MLHEFLLIFTGLPLYASSSSAFQFLRRQYSLFPGDMRPFQIPLPSGQPHSVFEDWPLTSYVLSFHVSKQWHGYQCLGFLMCAKILMRKIAHQGCVNTLRESALTSWLWKPLNKLKSCYCLGSPPDKWCFWNSSYSLTGHDQKTVKLGCSMMQYQIFSILFFVFKDVLECTWTSLRCTRGLWSKPRQTDLANGCCTSQDVCKAELLLCCQNQRSDCLCEQHTSYSRRV